MTTDEAIELVEAEYAGYQIIDKYALKDAFDMAIEALKNQPKITYLIRKEDALKCTHQIYWQCANCRSYQFGASNYCSNCGAKIKGWKEEDDAKSDTD